MSLPRHHTPAQGRNRKRVRYAVVGLGHIAQNAVLPAFENAASNSELAALISHDPLKLKNLGRKYRVNHTASYDNFEICLRQAGIDAVFICLPNDMHEEYTLRAAKVGVHVLCEKPLAVTAQACQRMIRECRRHRVKLMTAYRLHFDAANLEAIEIVQSGRLGEPRIFNSVFSFQVKKDNIRVRPEKGGGTLYDIGVYCINAARYLFQDEPQEVFACTANNDRARFRRIEEMTSAMLRFPNGRLAAFTCSFGAADEARYEVVGTEGVIRLINAYEYEAPIEVEIVEGGQSKIHTHKKRDQFAAELVYFSDCIINKREPEPSGIEGLVDVKIVEALYESARIGRPVKIGKLPRTRHPQPQQRISCSPPNKPKLLRVEAPTRD